MVRERWSDDTPVRIRFGAGRLAELPELVGRRRALLVTTLGFTRRGQTAQVAERLGDVAIFDGVRPNPDLAELERAGAELLAERIEVVVGMGGGSAIDTAKALSLILALSEPDVLRAHLEAGAALPDQAPLPLIAVPTTAGTGSEVTPFATIWDRRREKKYSLATPGLFPQDALLDPALTLSLPYELTVATGLDALSQAFEAIWNRNATPATTNYALEAIVLAFEALPALPDAPASLEYRSMMLEASLLAGLAISRTRTALSHAISYPITARFGMPHGLACGFTLPALLEFNAAADDGRLAELAARLGLASAQALRDELAQLLRWLGVDAMLGRYIAAPADVLALAPQMFTPGRADNNMRRADETDVIGILSASLDLGNPIAIELGE